VKIRGHKLWFNFVILCCSSTTVLKGASQQENLVYQIIQDAGNKGSLHQVCQKSIPLKNFDIF